MNETTQAKLENFRLTEYGKIALQFRRGMIDLDEALFCWDTAQHRYRELEEMGKACETDIQRKCFEAGLNALVSA